MKREEKKSEDVSTENDVLVEKLRVATEGLLYISETDAPLIPFCWPAKDRNLTPEFVKQQARVVESAKVSTQSLDEFLEPVAMVEEWMNAEEKAEARRFQKLQKTLEENLKNITVFRFGETNLEVFIIGKTKSGFAGVQTKVVET